MFVNWVCTMISFKIQYDLFWSTDFYFNLPHLSLFPCLLLPWLSTKSVVKSPKHDWEPVHIWSTNACSSFKMKAQFWYSCLHVWLNAPANKLLHGKESLINVLCTITYDLQNRGTGTWHKAYQSKLAIPHYYGCMSNFLNYAETYHLLTVSAALVELSMPVCTVL